METIGIIGAGRRAGHHCGSLAHIDEVEILGVSDQDEAAAEQLADESGIDNTYTDHETLLDEALDGVYLLTPPEAMGPIVPDILESGLDLFIEKPPGVSPDLLRSWSEMAERYGCETLVGFQRRFNPLARAALRRVSESGPVGQAVATFHKDDVDRLSEPQYNPLLHDGIHAVDMLSWAGGGIESVDGFTGQLYAEETGFDANATNFYVAVLKLSNGGIGVLNCNRAAGGRFLAFEVHGDEHSAYTELHGDRSRDECLIQEGGESIGEADRLRPADALQIQIPEGLYYDGTHQINRHFVDCLAGHSESRVPLRDTIDVLEAVHEILRAKREGFQFTDE
jgi:predicted dehydrogenase